MTIQIGSRVLVKDNAFGDSTNPEDVEARGKTGVVVWIDEDRIEVQTTDDDFLPLTLDEVEELPDD